MFGLMPRTGRTAVARREREPFEMLRREMASLFGFPTWPLGTEELAPWAFETEERENELVLRAEMPGFEPGEIEVTLRGNELTARAEHTATENGEAPTRRHALVERTVTLPENVEAARIEANYRNGVLEIHVPRAPGALPHRIEVK
ncbi:MAG: Hsp20/alpha crystallin family protein [Planctomycetes bacterium]|nr:Hsp20/alpha crystallin family protein [Planctomycetota bacterium]